MNRILAVVLVLSSLPAWAEQEAMLNVISFNAEARAEVPNDQVEVLLQAEKSAARPEQVTREVNSDMAWALKEAGKVKAVRAETSGYRTEPRYDKSGAIVSWRAVQQLTLRGTDIEAATALASALQARLQISNMTFSPSNATRDRVEEQLTERALAQFRARAEQIRVSMGAQAYDVVSINLNSNAPGPQPMYRMRAMAMEAAADVAVDAGSSELTVTANGQIRLR